MTENETHPTRIDIPISVHTAAKQAARSRGMSLRAFVIDAMIEKLTRSAGFDLPHPADARAVPVVNDGAQTK